MPRPRGEFKAGQAGGVQVENQQVEVVRVFGESLPTVRAVGKTGDGMPVALQQFLEQQGNALLVLGDENAAEPRTIRRPA